tara:strand:+ start:2864 stop:3721 length:858 start_codon:yes stop_codon:yes gene_type:complete
MPTVKFNNPLTLEIGAGITASLNEEQLDTVQMDGSDNTNLVLSIGQNVSTDADTTFNAVSGFPSMSIGGPGGIVIGDHLISGSGAVTGSLEVSQDFSAQNIFVRQGLIAENFSFGEESSSRIEESGSTKFGNDLGDVQNFTGSVKPNSVHFLNKTTSSFTEISNDAGLTGNSQTAVVTEFAAKKFYDGMDETPPYVRKNFVHKGVVNSQTETHFNAFTASAPFGFDPPSIKDFFVFQNGLNMEPDALTITQSGSIMVLSVDSSFNAQGYGFDFDDEIVAMGKFNS